METPNPWQRAFLCVLKLSRFSALTKRHPLIKGQSISPSRRLPWQQIVTNLPELPEIMLITQSALNQVLRLPGATDSLGFSHSNIRLPLPTTHPLLAHFDESVSLTFVTFLSKVFFLFCTQPLVQFSAEDFSLMIFIISFCKIEVREDSSTEEVKAGVMLANGTEAKLVSLLFLSGLVTLAKLVGVCTDWCLLAKYNICLVCSDGGLVLSTAESGISCRTPQGDRKCWRANRGWKN